MKELYKSQVCRILVKAEVFRFWIRQFYLFKDRFLLLFLIIFLIALQSKMSDFFRFAYSQLFLN
jgi:hypothetical protein